MVAIEFISLKDLTDLRFRFTGSDFEDGLNIKKAMAIKLNNTIMTTTTTITITTTFVSVCSVFLSASLISLLIPINLFSGNSFGVVDGVEVVALFGS